MDSLISFHIDKKPGLCPNSGGSSSLSEPGSKVFCALKHDESILLQRLLPLLRSIVPMTSHHERCWQTGVRSNISERFDAVLDEDAGAALPGFSLPCKSGQHV